MLLDHGLAAELDADRGAARRGLKRAAGAGAGDDFGGRAHAGFDVVIPAARARIAAGLVLHVVDEVLLIAAAERDVDLPLVAERAAVRGHWDLILTSEAHATNGIERRL